MQNILVIFIIFSRILYQIKCVVIYKYISQNKIVFLISVKQLFVYTEYTHQVLYLFESMTTYRMKATNKILSF